MVICFAAAEIPLTRGIRVQSNPALVEAAESLTTYIIQQVQSDQWICISLLPSLLQERLESRRIDQPGTFDALRQLFGQSLLAEHWTTLMDEVDKLHVKALQVLHSAPDTEEARKLYFSLISALQLCYGCCANLYCFLRWRSEAVERALLNYFRLLALITQTHDFVLERDLPENWKEINCGATFMQAMGVFHGEVCERVVERLELQYLDIHLVDQGIKPICILFVRLKAFAIHYETYGKG